MVFQSYALYPQMTVRGNMSFGLKIAGLPKAEIAKRVDRASEILQIGPLLDRKDLGDRKSGDEESAGHGSLAFPGGIAPPRVDVDEAG